LVRHDELVGSIVVADCERVAFVVLDQADDLEPQRGPVLHVQLQDVLEIERCFSDVAAGDAVVARARAAVGIDGCSLLEVPLDVRVVLFSVFANAECPSGFAT